MSKSLFDIVILSLLWGPSFVFMKVALQDTPPISIATIRIVIAAICLLIFTKLRHISLPKNRKVWLHATVMGFFASACPFVLFAYACMNVDSILGGIVLGVVPILTVLLAHFFVEDEKITLRKSLGVCIGLIGLLFLLVPKFKGNFIPKEFWSVIACFLGACCYAIGMVYTKKFLVGLDPMVLPTIQLSASSIILLPLLFLVDHPWTLSVPSSKSCYSILGLSILGTALAFVWYSRIVKASGSTALSMTTYLLPVIGAVLGIIFLGEKLTTEMVVAGLLIIFGMFLVNSSNNHASQ